MSKENRTVVPFQQFLTLSRALVEVSRELQAFDLIVKSLCVGYIRNPCIIVNLIPTHLHDSEKDFLM